MYACCVCEGVVVCCVSACVCACVHECVSTCVHVPGVCASACTCPCIHSSCHKMQCFQIIFLSTRNIHLEHISMHVVPVMFAVH